MTIRSRSRASSTASRAPPKTLWSVTAIAPSPIASAWSSRSSVSIAQSCDQLVCRWRSQRIHSRSPSGSALRCTGRVSAALARGSGRARRARARRCRSPDSRRDARASRPSRSRSSSFSARRARAARAELGLLEQARRIGERGAGRAGLERHAREAVRRGQEDRRLVQERRPARLRRGACARARGRAATAGSSGGPSAASSAGSRAPSSGSSGSTRSAARVERALAGPPLDDRELALLRRAGRARGRRPARRRGTSPGKRSAAASATRSRDGEQRVGPAEQPLALRAARRVAQPLGREEGGRRQRPRLAQREVREARQARARSACTTSKLPRASASARFARTPTGTPMRLRREMGRAGPSAITSASSPSWSARRPARRSAARPDGASTVTEWPSSRRPAARPATCSLTSCGCDQENGVTRQMRKLTSARV